MDDTLAPWLRLREPADADARSVALARAVARHAGAHDPVRVLDLACGTGANLRYLAPHLPGGSDGDSWTAIRRCSRSCPS
jgi:cyclopropane fatty-acyl-phospholipid synthase-like methyltransferase